MSIKRLNKERRPLALTPTVAKKVSDKNITAWVSAVYFSNLIEGFENNSKLLESFAICLLKEIDKPVQFGCMWTGLTVLFSRQITNGSKLIFYWIKTFQKNTVETNTIAFHSLIF